MAQPNPQTSSQHSPRTGSQDGSVDERRKQEAAAARKKVDDRRRQMSGAAGWVASRAGDCSRRDEAVLAGRTGFVRLAIRSGVPIVPVATVGAQTPRL